MSTSRPIPQPTPDTAPFWSATLEGQLSIQQCRACGKYVFYPRLLCPACLSSDLNWMVASGRGTVYSYTVVQRAPAAFASLVPYVVGLIELDEGPRLMSWIKTDVHSVRIGMRVKVTFQRESDAVALPIFVPSGEAET